MRALLVVLAGCGRLGFASDGRADASQDGPRDGDETVVCSPSFLLCDGFEDGLDVATWQVDTGVVLDTRKGHRGTRSVHVSVPAFGAGQVMYRTIGETKTFATPSASVWIRAYVWLSALPEVGNRMELVTAERAGSVGNYLFLFGDGTTVYSQFDDGAQESPTTPPVGSWFCALFRVERSQVATGSLHAGGDLAALTLTDTITDGSPPIDTVTLGAGFAPLNVTVAQPALDMWIDDVIVHAGPITCAD